MPSPATTSAAPLVVEAFSSGTFQRPAAWAVWTPNEHLPLVSGPLLYLSTEPLLATCAVTPGASPNPPDAQGLACQWPLQRLRPDGVFVEAYTTRILVQQPSAGESTTVNGEPARLRVDRPGDCAAIGGEETIDLLIPIGQYGHGSNVALEACLRGPDLVTSEAQVRAMVASMSGLR